MAWLVTWLPEDTSHFDVLRHVDMSWKLQVDRHTHWHVSIGIPIDMIGIPSDMCRLSMPIDLELHITRRVVLMRHVTWHESGGCHVWMSCLDVMCHVTWVVWMSCVMWHGLIQVIYHVGTYREWPLTMKEWPRTMREWPFTMESDPSRWRVTPYDERVTLHDERVTLHDERMTPDNERVTLLQLRASDTSLDMTACGHESWQYLPRHECQHGNE